jgi:hypothetical protein
MFWSNEVKFVSESRGLCCKLHYIVLYCRVASLRKEKFCILDPHYPTISGTPPRKGNQTQIDMNPDEF